MTDNKLTDNEIIKALEIYIACYGREIRVDDNVRIGDIYDLINRLQAENERLEKVVEYKQGIIDVLFTDNAKLLGKQSGIQITAATNILRDMELILETAKAEAYKECIEKVKALFPSDNEPYQYWEIHEGADNLLKELVGE